MTASGYCYNTSQKLPVLGSQYVFTIAGIPSGAKVRYYVDGEETLYRSIQPVWKDTHTVKVLALTDADMIDDDKSGSTVSIETATTDTNAIYYRLDGIPVPATALTPGFYIRRQAGSATKLLIK